MIRNLFSIFDTSTNSIIELNWISSISNLLILPLIYWFFFSKFICLINKIYLILFNEFKIIIFNKFNKINIIFFISLFILILINNIIGLYPYIFTRSRHIIFSISLSLPIWIILIIFIIKNNLNLIFSHIIPNGTPHILIPFIVIIETIRNFIRSGTLSIRLTANIIAGHLLLTLLSQRATSPILIITIIILITQIILLLLEFSVSIIQSYVFTILSTLYIKETN